MNLEDIIRQLLRRTDLTSASIRSGVYRKKELRTMSESQIDATLCRMRDAGIIAFAQGKWYLRNYDRGQPQPDGKRESDPRQLRMWE